MLLGRVGDVGIWATMSMRIEELPVCKGIVIDLDSSVGDVGFGLLKMRNAICDVMWGNIRTQRCCKACGQ